VSEHGNGGRYLLDTAVLSAYLQGRPGARELVSPWISQKQARTSILVYAEVTEYLQSFADPVREQRELRQLLGAIPAPDLPLSALERYASIRRVLRPPFGPGLIGDIDTLIAATAMDRDLVIVTTDSDSSRVPQLRVMLVGRADYQPVGEPGVQSSDG
jgi:predicted nucleic acid-binding protein